MSDEALVSSKAIGRWLQTPTWSASATAWDAEVVTGLMQLQGGKTPERLLAALRQPDIYNAQRHQDAQGRDLDAIFDDFQSSRLHLEEWLSGLSERALSEPRHYKALGGWAPSAVSPSGPRPSTRRAIRPFLDGFCPPVGRHNHGDEWSDEWCGVGETIPLGQIDILSVPGANGDTAEPGFPEDDDDDFE